VTHHRADYSSQAIFIPIDVVHGGLSFHCKELRRNQRRMQIRKLVKMMAEFKLSECGSDSAGVCEGGCFLKI